MTNNNSTPESKTQKLPKFDWNTYTLSEFFDETVAPNGRPRLGAESVYSYFGRHSERFAGTKQAATDLAIKEMGISFTIYSEGENIDRSWPLDILPRTIPLSEWNRVEKGLIQRLTALNLFINDVYNEQKIIKDGVFPLELIESSKDYLSVCKGIKPKYGVWANICGSDLVRSHDGTIYVLEDNLRVPSGVSYMLENRAVSKRVLPQLFSDCSILPVDDYPSKLFEMLASLSPRKSHKPEIVVLTPGIYNSAYFEHSYLSQRMGAELVTGSDILVGNDDCVYMKTISGLERVDVVYRRINDDFLDPEVFNPQSQLGTPGLFRAWAKGNVALANAPGAGVADDKVVYTYVPKIIKYYLGEEPILPNVPSYLCMDPKECEYVLQNMEDLVVKPANESGGYGMIVGPMSTKQERLKFAELIKAKPRNYMAQPTLKLSTAPTLCNNKIEPRHLDLRPFILQGSSHYVTPGGLTRVALRKGSLVVNSSQGGGSKDTWIVDTEGN